MSGRLAFAFFVLAVPAPAFAEPQLPEDVSRALDHNAAALNVLSLSWEEMQSSQFSEAALLEHLGPKANPDILLPYSMLRFARQDGMYYDRHSSRFRLNKRTVQKKDAEWAFDKEYFYYGSVEPTTPENAHANLSIEALQLTVKRTHDMPLVRDSYFRAAGFHLFRTASTLSRQPDSIIQYWIKNGAAVTAVQQAPADGVACLALELTDKGKVARFYLDRSIGYALRRCEQMNATGKLESVVTNSSFIQLKGTQAWMPSICVTHWYTWNTIAEKVFDKPLLTTAIRASNIDNQRMPLDQFQLNYKRPGSIVSSSKVSGAERTEDGQVTYRIPADPSHLDQAIEIASQEQRQRSGRAWLAWSAGGAVLVGFLAAFLFRWRSRESRG